jgi:hypothetical protein
MAAKFAPGKPGDGEEQIGTVQEGLEYDGA